MKNIHTPVLTKEVLQYLNPKPNENFIDATIGEAGHAIEILEKSKPDGRLLGIDLDPEQIENSRLITDSFKERIILVNDSYVNLKEIVEKINFKPVHGILLDLGYSSWQLEQSKRGFSFSKDEILDMRYNMQSILTAEKIINEYPKAQIEKILQDYGQEHFARQIANKISEQRKIKKIQSTFQLKAVIEKAIPPKFRHGKINFATRTFQALRIAVNEELNNLAKVLPDAVSVLSPGGRLVVISFHSLEDRIVKMFFKQIEKEGIIYPVKSSQSKVSRKAGQFNRVKILTPKPVMATSEEVLINARSRSAKLRALYKI